MPLTAGAVIDAARNKHSAFNERDHPGKALRVELGRLERTLLQRAIERNQDYVAAVQSTPLPLSVFANGITLPAHLAVHDAELKGVNNATREVELAPWHARNDPRQLYTASQRGQVLYLLGTADQWNGWVSIDVTYTPRPTAPASAAAVLTVDELAEDALVTGLAAFMAGRGSRDSEDIKVDVRHFEGMFSQAVMDFELAVGGLRAGDTFRTREVW